MGEEGSEADGETAQRGQQASTVRLAEQAPLHTAVSSENENSDWFPLTCISGLLFVKAGVCRMLTQVWWGLNSQEHTCPWRGALSG